MLENLHSLPFSPLVKKRFGVKPALVAHHWGNQVAINAQVPEDEKRSAGTDKAFFSLFTMVYMGIGQDGWPNNPQIGSNFVLTLHLGILGPVRVGETAWPTKHLSVLGQTPSGDEPTGSDTLLIHPISGTCKYVGLPKAS